MTAGQQPAFNAGFISRRRTCFLATLLILVYHDGKIGTSHLAEQTAGAFFGALYNGVIGIIGFEDFMGAESCADTALLTPSLIYRNSVQLSAS
jgi:hypothetical protein